MPSIAGSKSESRASPTACAWSVPPRTRTIEVTMRACNARKRAGIRGTCSTTRCRLPCPRWSEERETHNLCGMRRRLPFLFLAVLAACAGNASPALAPVPAAMSPPPPPLPTDWKGLFDSDSLPSNVPPPASDTVKAVLAREPSCVHVETIASGAFSAPGRAEQAYLLSCGSTRRLVTVSDAAAVAPLDVAEDILEEAGDLDLDGRRELLLIGRSAASDTVRVLGANGGRWATVASFSVPLEPCSHTIFSYRLVNARLEYREDKLPKRCTP